MSNLAYRQSIIQEKRKKTPWREFVMEICSRFPVNFYKNQGYISRYPETKRSPKLVSHKDFGDLRDKMISLTLESDVFFSDFLQLFMSVILSPTIQQGSGGNTDYADSVVGSSNSYLSAAIINDCKEIIYSQIIFDYCVNVVNSLWIGSYSENIYSSVCVVKSTNIFYSQGILNSNNIYYSSNLIGCSECIQCNNLVNQSYCLNNVQYTKERFLELKKDYLYNLSKLSGDYHLGKPENFSSTNVQGNYLYESSNVSQGYFANKLHNARNVFGVGGLDKELNFYDVFDGGVGSYDMYANEGAGSGSNNVYCSSQIEHSSQIFYSYYLINCSFCLGCIGLKNKSYCILYNVPLH